MIQLFWASFMAVLITWSYLMGALRCLVSPMHSASDKGKQELVFLHRTNIEWWGKWGFLFPADNLSLVYCSKEQIFQEKSSISSPGLFCDSVDFSWMHVLPFPWCLTWGVYSQYLMMVFPAQNTLLISINWVDGVKTHFNSTQMCSSHMEWSAKVTWERVWFIWGLTLLIPEELRMLCQGWIWP